MKLNIKNKKVKVFIIIIIIVLLLLIIKKCSSSINNNDKLPQQPVVEVETIEEYEKIAEKTEATARNYQLNFIEFSNKEDSFECDENTAQAYLEFSKYFIQMSENYKNIKYIGSSPYSDQEYFDRKFEYYRTFGLTLKKMSVSMKSNNTDDVLNGFDELQLILDNIEGERRHEN